MSTTRFIKILFLIVVCSLALAACGDRQQSDTEDEESHHDEDENNVEITEGQYANAGIELGRVERKQISGTVRVNGVLDVPPQQQVSVSVPLGGFLKETPLLQGSQVKKGQVIATIENLDFVQLQQDYLEAKNQLEFAKADYERQKELSAENVNSKKTLQQAKTTFVGWQAKVSGLTEKLKVLRINTASLETGKITSVIQLTSPINGYVTAVNVNIGKFVNPSDILFEIVDTEHLHAELTVFEKDVPKLKIGQKVRFTLANETKERTATIYLIGREIGSDRTIRIHCHIDNEDINLLPGMYLKAVVETGGIEVPALPSQSIVDYQGKKYIFYQLSQPHAPMKNESGEVHGEEHHFTMLEVQVGNTEMGYTEVILPDDFAVDSTLIVTKNSYAILSKMKNSEEEGGDHH